MDRDDPVRTLTAIGFTALEAEVYAYLSASSAATGYRVAQSIGKPAANVYKAIDTLIQKGAVLVEEGESRLCRAVPPDELIDRLADEHRGRLAEARSTLARLERIQEDERVYQIRNREQVMARAIEMLRQAESIALLDLFPEPLQELRAEMEAAAARRVDVAAKIYAPAVLQGVRLSEDPDGARVRERWPGQWMNLVIDGKEHLIALLSHDGQRVLQAIWSQSVYISWVYHSALSGEVELARLRAALRTSASIEEVRSAAAAFRSTTRLDLPGYRILLERFGTSDGAHS
jgi:HTH-type transcriptional regulator, sugar sensing transcriptional regulator